MRLPTHEQVGALMQAADPSFKTSIALAAFAGLRLGEAAAIQVGDIDFLRKKLAVVRQVQRANQGSVELRPPKCGSERTVFLARELVELLASHIACNGVEPEPTSWIFRGGGEDPPHQNTIGHRWRRTLKRAGVSGVRLHDLRHYFASGLIAAGCDVVTVQRALGHARATTTLDTYSHLWPSAEDRGPRTRCRGQSHVGIGGPIPGHTGYRKPLTCGNMLDHTLTRKSTTSPSRIM